MALRQRAGWLSKSAQVALSVRADGSERARFATLKRNTSTICQWTVLSDNLNTNSNVAKFKDTSAECHLAPAVKLLALVESQVGK